jgi:hypothetical protein
MSGSERGYFSRRRVLSSAPSGTPIMPDNIVTAPNMRDTLDGTRKEGQKQRH